VRWHSRVARDEFRIRGTDGEINLTPLNGPEVVYPGGMESIPAPANLHYPCVQEFVTSCLDGAEYRSSAQGAIWTDWVTEQVVAQASACAPSKLIGQEARQIGNRPARR